MRSGVIVTIQMLDPVPFSAPVEGPVTMESIANHKYAIIRYDGDRKPRIGDCAACKKPSSLAWYIAPLGITVCGCSAECIADKVESYWERPEGNIVRRIGGEEALRLVYNDWPWVTEELSS